MGSRPELLRRPEESGITAANETFIFGCKSARSWKSTAAPFRNCWITTTLIGPTSEEARAAGRGLFASRNRRLRSRRFRARLLQPATQGCSGSSGNPLVASLHVVALRCRSFHCNADRQGVGPIMQRCNARGGEGPDFPRSQTLGVWERGRGRRRRLLFHFKLRVDYVVLGLSALAVATRRSGARTASAWASRGSAAAEVLGHGVGRGLEVA